MLTHCVSEFPLTTKWSTFVRPLFGHSASGRATMTAGYLNFCSFLADPASGGSDDWAKSKAGIKYVYLIELRPEEDVWDGFILDTNQLIPTGRETWEGVKVVVNAVLEKNNFRLVSRSRKRNSGKRNSILLCHCFCN